MFFNRKKKEPKQASNNIIYNLDEQPVFDKTTAEFLMDFDAEQKKILRFMIDYMVPVEAIAYKGLPYKYMEQIRMAVLPDG